jgi:hypothetical protein
MNALTIASAFRLRNKLKERIKKLSGQISRAEAVKDAGEAENTAVFDGKTFTETIQTAGALMADLRDLNLAIDRANSVNKADLITLESLKAEIALYEDIAGKCRMAEKVRYEFNAAGGRDKIELEPVLDQNSIVSRLDDLKNLKDGIEERIGDTNFKTPVSFDANAVRKLL